MSCSFHNSILIIKQQLIQFLHRQTMASTMLSIQEKKTISIEIYRPLRQFITFNYSEREAQNLEDDLQTLKNLRSDLERLSDSPDVRRDLLQTYYRVLCLVESRFPISPDKDHVNSITFTWYDSFKPKLKAVQQNIHLEKASVLFNLGSVYSQIGVSADRSSVNGLKLACNSFMASAGAFGFLKDNASLKASIGQSSITLDVSVECAAMLEKLMLAQAQECFFEKVISEGRTPGLCAKVSRQVGLFYEEAFAALNVPPLNQHFDRSWISHIQLKAALFYVEACYRYSLELHEKEEIADEIARIKCGISALVDAKKSMRGVSAKLVDIVNKLEANLNQNLDRAVKENDRVYLMRVPPPESLSPVPAYSLVKSMSMSEVLDASKEKMFASLIPDASAKALSRYTEMVDDIFRTQAEKLQQGSEITRVRLREMDLPDSILALEGNFSLPMDLKEDVEAVQICGGPSGLEAELQQLKDLTRVNHELLVQTEDILEKEAREDDQFRSQFGTRWTRPQSSNLTKKLLERLNRFAVNLKQAAESDARIERSMRDHSALMSILDHKPIESAIPTLARPIMSLDANEDAIVGALKQSLRQLENLGAQRAGLEDMLKEMKIKDDILPKLMISTGSYDDLFRKEIAKYDHICEEIAENIMAQEQLLLQIQAQNNDFAAMFNLEDYKASREKSYKQIAAAILKFREIKENIDEGMKFYVTLQDAITNVKQQSSDFVATRKMQCRETIDDVQRQVAGLSFQDGRSGYGSHNSNHAASLGQQHQTQSATQPQPQPQPQQHPHPQSHPQSQPQSHPQLQQPPHSQPPPQSHPYAQSQPRPQPQPHPQPPQASHTQPPYYQPTEQPTAAYVHPHPSYGSSPHQPQLPPHYQLQASGNPYPPAQSQQPPHQYGQPPAYQGWPGQYYNAQNTQQPGYQPRPPHYNIPGPYPPHHQSGYYRQQ